MRRAGGEGSEDPYRNAGAVAAVPYTPPEANPDNKSDEATTLRVRGLYVDDRQREWTVGDMHEVTDRSFVVRRALRINDSLPGGGALVVAAGAVADGRPCDRANYCAAFAVV